MNQVMTSILMRFNALNLKILEIISRINRSSLCYALSIIFMAAVLFVSISIRNYINDSLPVRLVEPISEESLSKSEEELIEDSSVAITIKKGDTLSSILAQQKLSKQDINQIISLAKEYDMASKLQIGKQVVFDYEARIIDDEKTDLTQEDRVLNKVTFVIDKLKSLEMVRQGEKFIAKTTSIALDKFVTKSQAVIKTNLMSTLKSLGLSSNSIIELINYYSYQIDFQRQLKHGDTITVISEKFFTKEGGFSHQGNILYASLNLSGKDYNMYRYDYDQAKIFFSEDGKSIKRSLLKTPMKVTKISSHYGNRKHPTLGYNKMHKGVDFAAPVGTPIYAAGNGVVTEIGVKSGYGKYIQIKHSSTLSTAYAHASKFAKNLKIGSVVKQGQVIAYVGMTGRTTGPHLHYEVKIAGKHVNPMSVKTSPNIELSGTKLAKFKQFKQDIKALSSKLDIVENNSVLAKDVLQLSKL